MLFLYSLVTSCARNDAVVVARTEGIRARAARTGGIRAGARHDNYIDIRE